MKIKISHQVHCVYKTINNINGKEYVGVHSTYDVNDNYIGSGTAFIRAIKKYGKNNFTKTIIHQFNTREEALLKEKEIVCSEYLKNKNVYNIMGGGGGSPFGLNKDDYSKCNPSYSQDYDNRKIFYIDESGMISFKGSIAVGMDSDSRDIVVFRKMTANLLLNDIDNILNCLNLYWNDNRFHDYANNCLTMLYRLGFDQIIKATNVKAA